MRLNHQQLRPSQFITTYGPGAILETGSGPVVISSLERLFVDNGIALQDFEIRDSRLTRDPALNGAGIVRIPTNAELGREQQFPLYPSEAFPYWSLCRDHWMLHLARNACPLCPPRGARYAREKAGREAIRFVRACPAGHLDDVDWNYLVHGGPACPGQRGVYSWSGGGSSLRNVELRCPECNAAVNFGEAYARQWRCSARFPELAPRPGQPACAQPAAIIQRGAANLRIPRVISALTIPPLATRLSNILQDGRILTLWTTLTALNLATEANFRRGLGTVQPALGRSVMEFLEQCSWDEIRTAISQVLAQAGASPRALKDEEFDSLRYAAAYGAPPVPSPQVGAPPLFEVRLADVRQVQGPTRGCRFRVVPVSRLRMVIVQLGYQRLNPPRAQVVPVAFQAGGRSWYPGVELFGEGIYLDAVDDELPLTGERARAWDDSYMASSPQDQSLHPVHVWWHTFSHRLLRALSVDSGYSSAAIQERVFLRTEPDGRVCGGLLLSTVQPGGDGTLGGLIALVPTFEEVITSALRDLASCSNDPLCEETVPDGVNGAACYSCLLASETSCEQRNVHLDRALLLQNMP